MADMDVSREEAQAIASDRKVARAAGRNFLDNPRERLFAGAWRHAADGCFRRTPRHVCRMMTKMTSRQLHVTFSS